MQTIFFFKKRKIHSLSPIQHNQFPLLSTKAELSVPSHCRGSAAKQMQSDLSGIQAHTICMPKKVAIVNKQASTERNNLST